MILPLIFLQIQFIGNLNTFLSLKVSQIPVKVCQSYQGMQQINPKLAKLGYILRFRVRKRFYLLLYIVQKTIHIFFSLFVYCETSQQA